MESVDLNLLLCLRLVVLNRREQIVILGLCLVTNCLALWDFCSTQEDLVNFTS